MSIVYTLQRPNQGGPIIASNPPPQVYKENPFYHVKLTRWYILQFLYNRHKRHTHTHTPEVAGGLTNRHTEAI